MPFWPFAMNGLVAFLANYQRLAAAGHHPLDPEWLALIVSSPSWRDAIKNKVSSFPYCWPFARLKRVAEFPPVSSPQRELCRNLLLTIRNGRRSTARNPPGARSI